MSSTTKEIFGSAAAVLVAGWLLCGAVLAGILIDALVLKTLWAWFVVPHFELAPLTIPIAGGLAAIAHLFRRSDAASADGAENDDSDDPKAMRRDVEKLRNCVLSLVLRPLLLLAIGWLLTLWM